MPTTAEKAQYQSELSTLQGQRTTAVSNLSAAESSYASARDLRAQRISELALIEQKIADRQIWISS